MKAVNWNDVPEFENGVWKKLTDNFWLPEKVPLSNDLKSWSLMSEEEHGVTKKVFGGLTLLDTLQGTAGAVSLLRDSTCPYQDAILCNMAFMEQVHAKSYSSIFATLCSSKETDEIFEWVGSNKNLQLKANLIEKYYDGTDPHKKKIASTMLEGVLFYSGFFWPLYLSSNSKLTNTADLIRLIIRDEAIHAYMIGKWYQDGIKDLPEYQKEEYKTFTYELLTDLYVNEMEYTQELYDPVGLTESVKTFVRYNANKALQNLGYEPMFSTDQTQVEAAIISALSPNSGENHDFFSGSGSSYVIGKAVDTEDDDWAF